MTAPAYDLSTVLQDLAAGRIDPTEAARRIDAISASHDTADLGATRPQPADGTDHVPADRNGSGSGPSAEVDASPGSVADPAADPVPTRHDDEPDLDAWAASTDRPQRPGHPIDPFPGRVPPAEAPVGTPTRAAPGRR